MPSKNLGRVSIVPKGTWNANTVYNRLDAVVRNGSSWLAKKQNAGQMPGEGSDTWQMLAERGADGKTPVYGIDYGTPEQIAGIAEQAAGILAEDIQKISDGKVDKVDGKGLSSNDYDNAAKGKVDAIPDDPKYTDTVYDDTAVKDDISQIKDDLAGKLPKSPASWEQWTAEEQAAARERIGIPGDYELIDTITIEEDSVLDFTFPYPCKNVLIIGKINKFAAKTSHGYFKINRNVNYPAPFDGIPNTYTTNTEWSVEIMTNGPYITIINMRSDNRYLGGVQKSTRYLSEQSISSLKSTNEFLAGTELIVCGVRA